MQQQMQEQMQMQMQQFMQQLAAVQSVQRAPHPAQPVAAFSMENLVEAERAEPTEEAGKNKAGDGSGREPKRAKIAGSAMHSPPAEKDHRERDHAVRYHSDDSPELSFAGSTPAA
eukprot:1248937-Pleurochrysis_carterae.AAC.1